MPTPRKPKGKSGKNAPPLSALDSEKRLLQERQRQIDEKDRGAQPHDQRGKPAGLPDQRCHGGQRGPSPPRRPRASGSGEVRRRPPKKVVLRAERQEGRLQTFALLIVVLFLVLWALALIMSPRDV